MLIMNLKKIIIVSAFILCALWQASAQQNPFLTTETSGGDDKKYDSPNYTSASPFVNSALMQRIKNVQKQIQARISDYITEYKSSGDIDILFTFLGSAFLYGLIHVLGPGHRKIFLFSYFVSRPSRWKQGMFAGFMTAVLHAFSAIIIVGGLYFITTKALLRRFNNITPIIERVSYAAIVLIGIYLLLSHVIGIRKGRHPDNDENHKPDTILFILASGLIPCPGAATIMIFSIAVQAPLIGIYAVISMSLGMAVVLSLVPPAAIVIQNRIEPMLARWNPKTGKLIHSVISVTGAGVMIIFGLLLLI